MLTVLLVFMLGLVVVAAVFYGVASLMMRSQLALAIVVALAVYWIW